MNNLVLKTISFCAEQTDFSIHDRITVIKHLLALAEAGNAKTVILVDKKK